MAGTRKAKEARERENSKNAPGMDSSHKPRQEFRYDIKIPKERVAVLIGRNGEVKKEIEASAGISINVDSKEGDVFVLGSDPIMLYSAKEVIHAIGRGFNPEIAMLLFKQDYLFELVNILDFAKTKSDIVRLKGRIIGSGGKSRSILERLSETFICVYGKTVGIIGNLNYVPVARRAVEMLLEGSPHSKVFAFLERNRKKMNLAEREGVEGKIKDSAKKYL